jgi:hypothetical protein
MSIELKNNSNFYIDEDGKTKEKCAKQMHLTD